MSATSSSVHATSATSSARARWSRACSLVAEQAWRRGAHQRREPEQVVDEFGAGQHRPHAFEGFLTSGRPAQAARKLVFPAFGQRLAAGERARDDRVDRCRRGRSMLVTFGARSLRSRRALVRADRRGLVASDEQVEEAPRDVRAALVVRAASSARARSTTRALSSRLKRMRSPST